MFIYKKGQTSVDDIIEHILMRLNSDFAGGSLQVPDFCSTSRYDYDHIMEMKVRDKMYRHGIAERSDGAGQPETAIMLTAKGADVFDNGGWKAYLDKHEQQLKLDQEKSNKPTSQIVINGPVTGSQIGHESDFGNLESSHNSIALETPIHKAQPKDDAITISKKETIWNKIYKWTDHKLISMLIYGLIGFLLSRLITWLGWF